MSAIKKTAGKTTTKPRKSKAPALTKAGAPRVNKPGAGRPESGRTASPPRIHPNSMTTLKHIAESQGEDGKSLSLAEAIELSARVTMDIIIGISPQRHLKSKQ